MAMMHNIGPDENLLTAHQLLVARSVIEPLSDDDDEVRRWLAWELASLIEDHFQRTVDVNTLSRTERSKWEHV
jgi:hypothetical protein